MSKVKFIDMDKQASKQVLWDVARQRSKRIGETDKAALIYWLDNEYKRYCDRKEAKIEHEEYLTDRAFAANEVGDFLDWLEEECTGKRPQPDTVVRYYRKAATLQQIRDPICPVCDQGYKAHKEEDMQTCFPVLVAMVNQNA